MTAASVVDAALAAAVEAPRTEEELEGIYRYRVPVTTDDGACAASKELAPDPFDLATELLGTARPTAEHAAVTTTLLRLRALVHTLAERTKVDWLGVYRLQNGPNGYARGLQRGLAGRVQGGGRDRQRRAVGRAVGRATGNAERWAGRWAGHAIHGTG